jgi:hypothetical protein
MTVKSLRKCLNFEDVSVVNLGLFQANEEYYTLELLNNFSEMIGQINVS